MTYHIAVNTSLKTGLDNRQRAINNALEYVKQTRGLFETYGSPELKTLLARFEGLEKSLKSSEVKLAFIGEFSRGKSSLVNALLGIKLLPTAMEATTAINTFIKSLPDNGTKPYIKIHFHDPSKEPLILEWEDDDVIKKWGTELDKEHRDARREVEKIEAFTHHELLDKGLIIVDTPGLESVEKHHVNITMRAIDESHVAIWLLSTGQLGGNATEWKFLRDTIRKNFRKFITVINMWDKVIEPDDEHEKQKPLKVREKEKIDIVINNFKKELEGQITPSELSILTSPQNLMGVSAIWGLKTDDPQKRELSRIDKLAERIAQMCTGPEAKDEILYKPLKALSDIQEKLLEDIYERLSVLESSKDLEERKKEIQIFEQEIKNLELELKNIKNESREYHNNAAKRHCKEITDRVVTPIKELKDEAEVYVTRNYVKGLIQRKSKTIQLPNELIDRYKKLNEEIKKEWDRQKRSIEKTLTELRASYEDALNKKTKDLKIALQNMDIKIPPLELTVNIDFSVIEEHQEKLYQLEKERELLEKEVSHYEEVIAKNKSDEYRLKIVEKELEHVHRRISTLGPMPEVGKYIKSVRKERDRKGFWGKIKQFFVGPEVYYEEEVRYDTTRRDEYLEKKRDLEHKLNNKEAELKRIMEEEERKTGVRMSAEAAKKKYEKEIKMLENRLNKQKEETERQMNEIVEEEYNRLYNKTVGELSKRINFLEKQVINSIEQLFDAHLKLLTDAVEEQFMEPLKAKQEQRQSAIKSIQESEAKVKQDIENLKEAVRTLSNIKSKTQELLEE